MIKSCVVRVTVVGCVLATIQFVENDTISARRRQPSGRLLRNVDRERVEDERAAKEISLHIANEFHRRLLYSLDRKTIPRIYYTGWLTATNIRKGANGGINNAWVICVGYDKEFYRLSPLERKKHQVASFGVFAVRNTRTVLSVRVKDKTLFIGDVRCNNSRRIDDKLKLIGGKTLRSIFESVDDLGVKPRRVKK